MRQNFAVRPIILAVLLAVAVPAAPAAAAAKSKRCDRKGSTTILRTAKVRVYEVGRLDRTVFGCLLRNGRRTAVAEYTSSDSSISDEPRPTIWVNRDSLAAHEFFCPPDASPCTGNVASYDLRRRARKYAETVPGGVISQLVLKSNGSFAYVAADTVRKADSAGIGELDPGPSIEKRSLARAGSIVYWTKLGQPFSARLA
jgi:hypothetical protein